MNPHLLYLVHEKNCTKGQNIIVNLAGDVCCSPLSPPCGPLQYQANITPMDGSAVEDRVCINYRTSCPSGQIYDPSDTPTGKDRSCSPCPSGQRKDSETSCISEPCVGAWTYLDTCNQQCGEKTRQKQYNITSENKIGCPFADKHIENEACPSQPACVSCQGNWTSFESCDHKCGEKQILETYNLSVVGNDGSVCPENGATRTTTCPSKPLCPEKQMIQISLNDPNSLGGNLQLTNGTDTIDFSFSSMTNSYNQEITCGPNEWTVSCSSGSSSATSVSSDCECKEDGMYYNSCNDYQDDGKPWCYTKGATSNCGDDGDGKSWKRCSAASTSSYKEISGHCTYTGLSDIRPQYKTHGAISTTACEEKCNSSEGLNGKKCIAYGSNHNNWCNLYTTCVPGGTDTWGGVWKMKKEAKVVERSKSTIKITVRDTYGDGLNGTTFKVTDTSDGTIVKDFLFNTFLSGKGPQSENVEVSCGEVKVSCEGGSYPEEVMYKIGTPNNESKFTTEKSCKNNNSFTFNIPCSTSSSSQSYSLTSTDVDVSSTSCEEKKFFYKCPIRYNGPGRYYISTYTGKKKAFVSIDDCAKYAQQEEAQVFAKYQNKCWLYKANDTQENLKAQGVSRTGSSMESYILY